MANTKRSTKSKVSAEGDEVPAPQKVQTKAVKKG